MIVLVFIAFISLGLPDGLLGVAWPGVRSTFGLPIDAIGLLLIAGTAGYMISTLLTGPVLRRLGVGGLLTVSIAMTATTLAVYATTPFWPLFIVAAALGGLGAGAIDAGVNIYVATWYSARVMQWLHACFGVGVTAGPLIMTAALTETGNWQNGYLVVCGIQVVLGAVFFGTRHKWQATDTGDEEEANLLSSMRNLPSVGSALLFFLYTGIEVGIGLWVFSLLTESRAASASTAGVITAAYWGTFTVGRVIAGVYAHRVSGETLVRGSMLGALAGCLLLTASLGPLSDAASVMLIGFAIAPVFPALTTDTHRRVGPAHERNTIGLQMSAAGFGAALMPAASGVLARQFGLEIIPPFVAVATLVLLVVHLLLGQRGTGHAD